MRRPPILLFAGLMAWAAPAVGQRAPDELRQLQAERGDERTRAQTLRRQAEEARIELIRLDAQLGRLGGAAEAEDARLAAQRARLAELGRREQALSVELSGERATLGRLLSALMLMGRRPPPPLLVPADRAVDTVRASILIRAATPAVERRARSLADRQAEIGRLRRLAALSSETLFTAESDRLNRRAEIETLRARRAALAATLTADAKRADRAAEALEARIRELGGRVDPVAPTTTTDDLPGGLTRLSPPVTGAPAHRYSRASPGWTWRGAAGEPVSAPAPGVVAFSGAVGGWGEVVILDLGPGWRVVLAGMDVRIVEAGQTVEAGRPLGEVGREDADVYLELRRGDRPVDPARWLD